MALFRPSAIAGAISGSIGGITFTSGKSAPVARHRPLRSQRTSASLEHTQSIFANATRSWSALSVAKRQTWRALAANIPRTNRLGQTSTTTGFALYVQRFMYTVLWTSPSTVDPPSIEGGATGRNLTLTATAPSTMSATFEFMTSKNALRAQVLGFRAFSGSLPKFRKPWRVVQISTMLVIASKTLTIDANWNAIYGPLLAEEAVAVRVRLWDPFTMWVPGPTHEASAIVQAP